MNKDNYLKTIKDIASAETSFDPSNWTPSNPLWGHCAVVSLLAQEIFGGEIVKGSLLDYPKYSYLKSHIWNRINEEDIDFTSEQYSDLSHKDLEGVIYSKESILKYPNTVKRLSILKERFLDTQRPSKW
ncbi:MAG: hypothetical protein QG614_132 [Patescibacteria group bacterium]|nr:hypothetical protein [Patescibacteria group bacterium]